MKVSQGIQSGCHPYLENRIQTSKHRLKSYEESEMRKHNESEEIQAMIGEHESVQQVRKDIKIVDQSNLHTTLCM